MAVNPIQAADMSSFFTEPREVAAPKRDGTVFAKVVRSFLEDVNNQQTRADQLVEKLVTGQTDDVQGVMLALTQADLSFRMAMEVRSRVVDAYQEVARMQL